MLGKRLRDLREFKNMKQYELSEMLNVSREAYSMYESDKRQMSFESLCFLADFFGVTTDYMLGRDNNIFLLLDFEKAIIEKLRKLDERGRQTVFDLLDAEYIRYGEKF